MSNGSNFYYKLVTAGLMCMLSTAIASNQSGIMLTKGEERILVPYGEGILVYDGTGELVASGTLESVAGNRLLLQGQYQHQVPLAYVRKLVVGPERTNGQELGRRLHRAALFEVAYITVLALIGLDAMAGGYLWIYTAPVVHGVQLTGFLFKVIQNSFADSYTIGPDDWRVVPR